MSSLWTCGLFSLVLQSFVEQNHVAQVGWRRSPDVIVLFVTPMEIWTLFL